MFIVTSSPWRSGVRLAASVCLAAVGPLSGCATYSTGFAAVEAQLAAKNYDAALDAIEQQSHASRDKILYLLNRGMVLRMKRDYRASNDTFEAAKKLMDELYGLSLREQSLTFVINDATTSYVGEEYEQVLLHLYKALNFLDLGELDAARVEALQVDVLLRQFGGGIPDNKYTEDAFVRYLTGLIYEELREWSDALIAYRKAYEAYLKYEKHYGVPVPGFLKLDLLRLAQRQGLHNEVERYRRSFGIETWQSAGERAQLGEIVFMLHNGLVPIKREQSANVLDPSSGHLIRISLPYYQDRPSAVSSARLRVDVRVASTEVAEDVGAIARQSLESKMAGITARAVARAAVKAAAAREARKAAQQKSRDGSNESAIAAILLGLSVEAATVLTERADTRSWLTLPQNIQLARVPLPPGNYDVRVELLGAGQQVLGTHDFRQVVVRKGHQTHLWHHAVPTPSTLRR